MNLFEDATIGADDGKSNWIGSYPVNDSYTQKAYYSYTYVC